jgi:murein DD-endopeptidase MepM/ murein hydrolase activator NlpD
VSKSRAKMRKTAPGFAFLLFGLFFAACNSETDSDDDEDNGTSGAQGGAVGKGGALGSSGASGASGASGGSGGSGASGATHDLGGAAGHADAGGASGTAQGDAGTANGDAGTASGGGSPGAGGEAGPSAAGASGAASGPLGLSWPIDCIPNQTCVNIGYPDTDEDGDAHDCGEPGYFGHQGTDIGITFDAQAAGTAVRAAADGVVLFAFDGKYDQCPSANEPDCQAPPSYEPGATTGNTVCTPLGPYCGTGEQACFWCFAGGNVIVIRHEGVPGVFATRYDHLKKNSVLVQPGDSVVRGQKIAEAASAGNSTGPHLHFEVWGTGFYELADPWAGACGPNTGPSLWAYDPPWSG